MGPHNAGFSFQRFKSQCQDPEFQAGAGTIRIPPWFPLPLQCFSPACNLTSHAPLESDLQSAVTLGLEPLPRPLQPSTHLSIRVVYTGLSQTEDEARDGLHSIPQGSGSASELGTINYPCSLIRAALPPAFSVSCCGHSCGISEAHSDLGTLYQVLQDRPPSTALEQRGQRGCWEQCWLPFQTKA